MAHTIEAVETIRLESRPSILWTLLHTSEGLTGLGETWFGSETIEADVHSRIAPLLIGEEVTRIEQLNRQLRPYTGYCGSGAELRAVSAVDVALWDIAGKIAGMPICDLLGGRCRDSIVVYNTCAGPDYVSQSSDVRPGNFGLAASAASGDGQLAGRDFQDLDAFLNTADDLAASLLEMGIDSMKIWPFDFADSAQDGLAPSAKDMKVALEPFEKIRRAHGDRMRIKAELHGLWTLPGATAICKALEPFEVDWVEDPVWMDRTDDLAVLAATTPLPLAGGETIGGLGQMRDLLQSGGLSYPIVDVTWGGGITFAKKAAAMAEAHALPIAFHDCSGPVTLTASTHLALACPNVREQEITRGFYYSWYHEYVDAPPPIANGQISVTGKPGLGMSLQADVRDRPGSISRVSRTVN